MAVALQNFCLLRVGRVVDADLHQEAIQLRFGQRIRPLELDWILRGEHGEMFRQRITHAVDGDLAFLHCFQKRGLGAGGGAIDLVDQEQVSEDGSAMQVEAAGTHVEDVGAGDVGGHQIGGALHALEAEAADASQCLDGERLRQARYAFNHGVPAADQNQQELIDDFALANDHFGEFGANVRGKSGKVFH